jgi:hypothetical protein
MFELISQLSSYLDNLIGINGVLGVSECEQRQLGNATM